MVHKKAKSLVGMDIVTPSGWGEVVEELSYDQILVEYPNRRREVFSKKDLKW